MNKKIGIGIGVVVLVLLLAGGAFTAVQLLTADDGGGEAGGTMVFEDVYDDGSGSPVSVKTIIEPSPDLPQEQPAAGGIYLSEEDSSYYVGTGNISISAQTINGETSVSADHSGPKVEVVVAHDTIFYKDVTKIDWNPTESGERRYVQELRQIDRPAELSQGNSLTVWGDKNGDRVIAKVIVIGEEH